MYNNKTMGLANEQRIDKKPEEAASKWTFKKIFSASPITTLTRNFVDPLEVLLGYLILVLGVAVVCDRHIPVMFYVLTVLMLLVLIFDRHFKEQIINSPIKNPKKK